MNGNSVVIWFPVHAVEVMYLTLDENLLLWELIAFRVVKIEKFHAVLITFFGVVLVNYSEVITLRMQN